MNALHRALAPLLAHHLAPPPRRGRCAIGSESRPALPSPGPLQAPGGAQDRTGQRLRTDLTLRSTSRRGPARPRPPSGPPQHPVYDDFYESGWPCQVAIVSSMFGLWRSVLL